MRYWWVNQNQTFLHELAGGYLWSPKRNKNGVRNPFYDFMRVVAPGDVVFSFADTKIKAVGIIASHGYEAPKPIEFGSTGAYWDNIGWRVDVKFVTLRAAMRPADNMETLRPLLPQKYSPLQSTGAGMQGVYLAALDDILAAAIVDLIGAEARDIIRGHRVAQGEMEVIPAIGLEQWEEHQLTRVRNDALITETQREQVVLARRGQGLFKSRVMNIERACRITGVIREEHLRASHCKPWRDSTNEERLNGENGLLLTPNADHLFDRGFIGFEQNGDLLVSPVADKASLSRLGIDVGRRVNVGGFSDGQRKFLEYHRESVLLTSAFIDL
jgi:putative restriction endonuclease